MLDFVDSCVGGFDDIHGFLLNLGLAMFLDLIDFVWELKWFQQFMFGFGFGMNWTHNPIVHLLADNKVHIKVYEREDVSMKVPSLNKKAWVNFLPICSYKIRMGSKLFQLSIKEKPTYKKTLRIPKQENTEGKN